ncbi:MAG: hypothetical protein C0402_00500 [Thermodesulfovibrio sp.]|nr:hypothetical protein [Thermodesulfovibrio sp.]
MKKSFFIIMVSILILSSPAFMAFSAAAPEQATAAEEAAPADEAYVFPSIAPEASFSAGYRHVDFSGSSRVDEYEYLKKSLAVAGEYRLFRFPHRFHLDISAKNSKDYFGDINYSYEDVVLFRGLFRGLYHNLDTLSLIDLNPATPSPGVLQRDTDLSYGVRWNMSNVFLRFKTHDFPFHVYFDGTSIIRKGSQQQRFLLGSGGNSSIIRTSQAREIDWKTQNLVVGINSHLGPLELDISHGEKRFDSGNSNVFFDSYTAVTGTPARAAGIYPHNLIPDFKGSTNAVKLHTSYTGGLVASMTLSNYSSENQYSGAKADYLVGAGDIIWTLKPNLQAYLKYRHKEVSIDNPESATMTDTTNPANTYTYAVEHAVTSITDTVNAGIKYRPFKGVSVRADYAYDDIRRDHVATLAIPEGTRKHTASLSADIRPVRGLILQARYAHKEIDNPAYNIDPSRSDEGKISATWLPFPVVSTTISYGISSEHRNDIHWLETDGSTTHGDERNVNRNRLVGSVTLTALKNVAITGSFVYIHNKIEQDIEYHSATGTPQVYPSALNRDMVQSYSLDMTYTPGRKTSITGGITHSISSGSFNPLSPVLLQPVSVASFSEMKMRETVLSTSGEYRINKGTSIGLQYKFSEIRDALNNPYDDIENGRAHIVLLTLSKKW